MKILKAPIYSNQLNPRLHSSAQPRLFLSSSRPYAFNHSQLSPTSERVSSNKDGRTRVPDIGIYRALKPYQGANTSRNSNQAYPSCCCRFRHTSRSSFNYKRQPDPIACSNLPRKALMEVDWDWDRDPTDPTILLTIRKRYEYQKLRPGNVRLIVLLAGQKETPIEIDFRSVSLEEVEDRYGALSYTWGSDEKDHIVSCSGRVLYVTQNLYDFFQAYRHETGNQILWVDQLSINQDDLEERREQVKMMGRIYSKARNSLIWLGKEIWDSPSLVEDVKILHQLCQLHEDTMWDRNWQAFLHKQLSALPPRVWRSIHMILSHPYFRRVWIIQEVIKAKIAAFLIGGNFVYFQVLQEINSCFQHADVPAAVLPRSLRANTRALMKIVTMKTRLHAIGSTKDMWLTKDKWTLLHLIFKSWNFLATDHRDKVYGLAGLLEYPDHCIPQNVDPDYTKDREDLMLETFIHGICEESCLTSLTYCQPDRSDKYPSWMPDPQQDLESVSELAIMLDLYRAGGTASSGSVKRIAGENAVLTFEVKFIGKVDRQSSLPVKTMREKSQAAGSDYRAPVQEINLEKYFETLEAYEKLAFGDLRLLSPEESELFARVMICDRSTRSRNIISQSELVEVDSLLSKLRSPPPEEEIDFEDAELNMLAIMAKHTSDVQFCCLDGHLPNAAGTRLPLMGWVMPGVQIGDLVCIVHGWNTPMVVRPCGDGCYKFLSIAFIGGMMQGEACDDHYYPSEQIMVR